MAAGASADQIPRDRLRQIAVPLLYAELRRALTSPSNVELHRAVYASHRRPLAERVDGLAAAVLREADVKVMRMWLGGGSGQRLIRFLHAREAPYDPQETP